MALLLVNIGSNKDKARFSLNLFDHHVQRHRSLKTCKAARDCRRAAAVGPRSAWTTAEEDRGGGLRPPCGRGWDGESRSPTTHVPGSLRPAPVRTAPQRNRAA